MAACSCFLPEMIEVDVPKTMLSLMTSDLTKVTHALYACLCVAHLAAVLSINHKEMAVKWMADFLSVLLLACQRMLSQFSNQQ